MAANWEFFENVSFAISIAESEVNLKYFIRGVAWIFVYFCMYSLSMSIVVKQGNYAA